MNFCNLSSNSELYKHPDYNNSNYQNDISLLILSKSIEFNSFIKPACLPKSVDYKYPSIDSIVNAVGWVF